jgi:hypothetical protein
MVEALSGIETPAGLSVGEVKGFGFPGETDLASLGDFCSTIRRF